MEDRQGQEGQQEKQDKAMAWRQIISMATCRALASIIISEEKASSHSFVQNICLCKKTEK